MKKACLVVHKVYQQGRIFDANSPLNRDNCLQFFRDLKEELNRRGVNLVTQDQLSIDQADLVIYNEMPSDLPDKKSIEKSYLLLFESELIKPSNWNIKSHQAFKKIFTWNNLLIDNKKYFKFNFCHPEQVNFLSFAEKSKFCTLIAGNKRINHPLELYSKRIEAIRWFENNKPEYFEFYGMGWDKYTFSWPIISKILNRISPLGKLFAEKWPSYKGPVKNKLELLKTFKFSICYENGKDIPGYITEKIFDSLAAGCIPVYWGAPDIKDVIPKLCYIDRTQFSSYGELFSYMSTMSENEYNQRLQAIKDYLSSDLSRLFDSVTNAKNVVESILA